MSQADVKLEKSRNYTLYLVPDDVLEPTMRRSLLSLSSLVATVKERELVMVKTRYTGDMPLRIIPEQLSDYIVNNSK